MYTWTHTYIYIYTNTQIYNDNFCWLNLQDFYVYTSSLTFFFIPRRVTCLYLLGKLFLFSYNFVVRFENICLFCFVVYFAFRFISLVKKFWCIDLKEVKYVCNTYKITEIISVWG